MMKSSTKAKLSRLARERKMAAKALLSTKHTLLAHIIPMRRCNLACGYCNEYDKVSDPVPLDEMKRRIDKLASFGTSLIVISGGEPMMHPQIFEIISHIRSYNMLCGLISNGYYMTRENIRKLNDAKLDYLQISIDNIKPDEVSQKSLAVLAPRYLRYLSEDADFHININSVIGGGIKNPEDALAVAEKAVELGFSTSLGIIHDGTGQLKPLSPKEMDIYQRLKKFGKSGWTRFNGFQDDLAEGKAHEWRCRAGARYIYVCEDGLVHYCSQQRGYPAVPLEKYSMEDVRREFYTEKPCASYCTIACVQQIAYFDNWRAPQKSDNRPSLQGEFEGGTF